MDLICCYTQLKEVFVGLRTTTAPKTLIAQSCYEQLCDHLNKPQKQVTVTTNIKNMPQINESLPEEFQSYLQSLAVVDIYSSNLSDNKISCLDLFGMRPHNGRPGGCNHWQQPEQPERDESLAAAARMA